MRRWMRTTTVLGTALGAAALALNLAATRPRLPGVVYVRASATGAADGSSWADAYPRLQDAIAAAAPGDQIWIAGGTYRPAPSPGNRDATFLLKNRVTMYGGFAGTETELQQRDWVANPTILSGDLAGDDGPGPAFTNRSDNCYHVVVALNVDDSTVIDGLVIRDGHADGPGQGATPESRDQGSGLNVYGSAPRVANCVFERNWCSNHGTINDHGSSTVINCTFRNNFSAQFGSGLYIHFTSATTANNCRFEANTATTDGGGVYSRSSTGAVVANSLFINNRADHGAGMYVTSDSNATIRDCTFIDNVAVTGGGGVFNDHSSPTVTGCTFTHNSGGVGIVDGGAGGGGSGGAGFWASGGTATVTNCTFTDNASSFGAGVYNNDFARTTVTNCVFTGNYAQEGGGLYALFSDVTVSGCTFTGNVASNGAFSVGGGVSTYFCSPQIRDCVFVANLGEVGGGGVYTEGESAKFTNLTFHRNAAIGGGICCGSDGWGGAVMTGYFTTSVFTNCVFTANRGDLGGAVFNISHTSPTFVNATMVTNTARIGGGVYGYSEAGGTLTNCIVWGNTSTAGGPAIDGVAPAVRYSCVQGGAPGEHNTSLDPRLVRLPAPGADGQWGTADDVTADLHLRRNSDAIDRADNGALDPLITTDWSAAPRFQDDAGMPDAGAGNAPIADLGAMEFQGVSCRADWDDNGLVQPADVAAFVQAWVGSVTQGTAAGDLDRDGVVQPSDVAGFVQLWFGAVASGC